MLKCGWQIYIDRKSKTNWKHEILLWNQQYLHPFMDYNTHKQNKTNHRINDRFTMCPQMTKITYEIVRKQMKTQKTINNSALLYTNSQFTHSFVPFQKCFTRNLFLTIFWTPYNFLFQKVFNLFEYTMVIYDGIEQIFLRSAQTRKFSW